MTCPKCGSDAGWEGPKFHQGHERGTGELRDVLMFTCSTCGYPRFEPTKDTPPGPPPRPPADTDPGKITVREPWLKGVWPWRR